MNLAQYVAYPQRGLALESAAGAVVTKVARRVLRSRLTPSISELGSVACHWHVDASSLLTDASWAGVDFTTEALASLAQEHDRLIRELSERYRSRRLAFPSVWAVESGTSFLLYALVRGLRPASVIEMGVGNGQSSYFILRALRANGSGRLHSFDIASAAGGLLTAEERAGWDFRLIDRWRGGKSLVAQLAELPAAELAFHDAGHGYLSQSFEFSCLWRQLAETGLLVSDDIDLSYGLVDFCAAVHSRPDILIDSRKAIAVMQRRGNEAHDLQPTAEDVPNASPRR